MLEVIRKVGAVALVSTAVYLWLKRDRLFSLDTDVSPVEAARAKYNGLGQPDKDLLAGYLIWEAVRKQRREHLIKTNLSWNSDHGMDSLLTIPKSL